MNQRDIRKAIYLSGIKPAGYTVHHAIDGEVFYAEVPSVSIGNAYCARVAGPRQDDRRQTMGA